MIEYSSGFTSEGWFHTEISIVLLLKIEETRQKKPYAQRKQRLLLIKGFIFFFNKRARIWNNNIKENRLSMLMFR